MVNSAEQAEQVVRWAKYAPLGTRGVGIGRAHGYGAKFQEYVQQANEQVAVIVQAEHIDAVNNIESIVQVAGVDAVSVGPYDLSASLGRLGEVRHPEVVAAIEHVTQVCQAVHLPLGIFGLSAEAVQPYIERGYTLITVGVDVVLMGEAAKQLLGRVRRVAQAPRLRDCCLQAVAVASQACSQRCVQASETVSQLCGIRQKLPKHAIAQQSPARRQTNSVRIGFKQALLNQSADHRAIDFIQLHAEAIGKAGAFDSLFDQAQAQHHRLAHLQRPIDLLSLDDRHSRLLNALDVVTRMQHIRVTLALKRRMRPAAKTKVGFIAPVHEIVA